MFTILCVMGMATHTLLEVDDSPEQTWCGSGLQFPSLRQVTVTVNLELSSHSIINSEPSIVEL